MENNKRVVLTIALVAVIAVAAIGIGYAYTASTTNTDNASSVEYYKIGSKADSAAISTQAADYTQKYSEEIQYNTETNSSGTTYVAVNGVQIDSLSDKWVANIGNLTLIAFDQNGNISAPQDKTHATLHISIATGTGTNDHNVNTNFTIIAKLGEFTSGDKPNHYTPEITNDTDYVSGYTTLTLSDGAYQGDLYVPAASLSTGFTVYLGTCITASEPITGDLKDENMAYKTTEGDRDGYVLYDADVKFSIDSEKWIAAST